MSISSELLTLNNTKTAIRTAINSKGGSVEASAPFASYATAIDNLPTGGGNKLLTSIDVSDFSGTTFNEVATYITSATIPSGVTSIVASAFIGSGLTSITIPNSVTSIGNMAFKNSRNLTSVSLPGTIYSFGGSLFDGCSKLASLDLSNNSNLTTVPEYTCNYCTLLASAKLPPNITSVGPSAFNNCTSLQSITIPSGVTSLGARAFYNCTSLSSIICYAATPPTLSVYALENTNNCPIYVPAASVNAYKTSWSDLSSRIFAIEDAITFTPTNGDPAISVKNYELATANYVQSTDVPATIKNGAGSLEIGEGVTRIGTFAFQDGTSLTSVTLPSTLTRMDEAVFYHCTALTSVTVNATTPPTIYGSVFDHTNNCPIYVPVESVDTYKAANNWSTYADRIQPIPVHVATLTLSDTSTVDLIDTTGNGHIVSSMTSQYASTTVGALIKADTLLVSTQAFSGFTNLASVTFETGSRCNTLALRAFQNCSSLTSVTIPSGVTTIGANVFEGCSSLETVTFETGSQLLMINGNVFKNCTSLTDITLPDSVTSVKTYAFSGCTSLTDISLPDSVTSIDNSAFSGCTSLETVAIGEGIEEMGVSVFSGCDNLTDITILADAAPDMSGEDPFDGCDATITMHVPAASVEAYQMWLNDDLVTAADITVVAIPSA